MVDSDWFMIHMILWISLIILIWLWQEESTGSLWHQPESSWHSARTNSDHGPLGLLGKVTAWPCQPLNYKSWCFSCWERANPNDPNDPNDPNVQRITQKYYVIDVIDVIVTYYSLVVHVHVPHRRIAISSNMISSSRHLDTLFDLSKDLHRLVGREWPEMKGQRPSGMPVISYDIHWYVCSCFSIDIWGSIDISYVVVVFPRNQYKWIRMHSTEPHIYRWDNVEMYTHTESYILQIICWIYVGYMCSLRIHHCWILLSADSIVGSRSKNWHKLRLSRITNDEFEGKNLASHGFPWLPTQVKILWRDLVMI